MLCIKRAGWGVLDKKGPILPPQLISRNSSKSFDFFISTISYSPQRRVNGLITAQRIIGSTDYYDGMNKKDTAEQYLCS